MKSGSFLDSLCVTERLNVFLIIMDKDFNHLFQKLLPAGFISRKDLLCSTSFPRGLSRLVDLVYVRAGSLLQVLGSLPLEVWTSRSGSGLHGLS